MIYGFVHKGSGLGNQLHRYVATRVLAEDKGYDFSMIGEENFKGKSFMNFDMGKKNTIPYHIEMPAGKIVQDEGWNKVYLWEEKTNYYNPEFNFVEDNTIIDGEFQDERYFEHRLNDVDNWLRVVPLYPPTTYEDVGEGTIEEPGKAPEDLCVIGFRGGEFYMFPELGLPKEYFFEAMKIMVKENPNMRFEVHTDDIELAKQFFSEKDFKIIHDVGLNWRSVRYAKYAIISNSSFYILPRLLKHNEKWVKPMTIAPRYWARHNTKEWSMPQNYYKKFTYI